MALFASKDAGPARHRAGLGLPGGGGHIVLFRLDGAHAEIHPAGGDDRLHGGDRTGPDAGTHRYGRRLGVAAAGTLWQGD